MNPLARTSLLRTWGNTSATLKWKSNQNFQKKHHTCSRISMLLIEHSQRSKESQRRRTAFQSLWDSLKPLLGSQKPSQECISRKTSIPRMWKRHIESSRSPLSTPQRVAWAVAKLRTPPENWQTSSQKLKKLSLEELPLAPKSPTQSSSRRWWWDSRIRELSTMQSSQWSEKDNLSTKRAERSYIER